MFKEVLIVALIFLVIIFSFTIIIKRLERKKIKDALEIIKAKYEFTLKESKKLYDFILENDDMIIYITYTSIPKNSSVTINSKATWCLRWGGSRVGRSYPHMRYMNELSNFLEHDFKSEKKTVKLVILFPECEKILKYLNESELAKVDVNDNNHGTKVIKYLDLLERFNEVIK